MKVYLRIINPVIAILSFFYCLYASTVVENGQFFFKGIWGGLYHSYIFAQGFFTFSTIFIIGEILLRIISKKDYKNQTRRVKIEYFYMLALLTFIIGSFISVNIFYMPKKELKVVAKKLINPNIKIKESHFIEEAKVIKLVVTLENKADSGYGAGYGDSALYVVSNFFVNTNFVGSSKVEIYQFSSNSEEVVVIQNKDFLFDNVKEHLTYKLSIE